MYLHQQQDGASRCAPVSGSAGEIGTVTADCACWMRIDHLLPAVAAQDAGNLGNGVEQGSGRERTAGRDNGAEIGVCREGERQQMVSQAGELRVPARP